MKNEKRNFKKLAATLAVLAAGSVFTGTVPADAKELKNAKLENIEIAFRHRQELRERTPIHDDITELRFRRWRRRIEDRRRRDWFDEPEDFPPYFRDRPPMPPHHHRHMPPPPPHRPNRPNGRHMPPPPHFRDRPPMPPHHGRPVPPPYRPNGRHMPPTPRGRR